MVGVKNIVRRRIGLKMGRKWVKVKMGRGEIGSGEGEILKMNKKIATMKPIMAYYHLNGALESYIMSLESHFDDYS